MRAFQSTAATTIIEPAGEHPPVEHAVVIFAQGTRPAILESSLRGTACDRYSIFATDPIAELEVTPDTRTNVISALAEGMLRYPCSASAEAAIPFSGGWIGWVAYEAGANLEPRIGTIQRERNLPLARFALYDAAAVYDHFAERWYVIAVDWPRPLAARRPSVGERLRVLRDRLRAASEPWTPARGPWGDAIFGAFRGVASQASPALRRSSVASRGMGPLPYGRGSEHGRGSDCGSGSGRGRGREPKGGSIGGLTVNMSRQSYLQRVERALRYIRAGDIYQVNLSQRFTARTKLDPVELYLRLRAASPSSHAAFLAWDDNAVLSSSPELFLDLRWHDLGPTQGDSAPTAEGLGGRDPRSNGWRVVTRPIKGTRPRTGDPRVDAVNRSQLATSEKERAELTMIIDLLRNDLGRVCSFGSVRVTSEGDIEAHPTVYHRVATIEGALAPDRTWRDLLSATFPGGSVTGAPKIRAMQVIRELEPTPRGVYCGSIGWIGLDGAMSMNIAIRTMWQHGRTVHAYAGGAIVADSDPASEYAETLAKAAGMLAALGETRFSTGRHWPRETDPIGVAASPRRS